MDSHLIHKGFLIYHDGVQYVAEEQDHVEGEPVLEIGSKSVDQLLSMIDALDGSIAGLDRLSGESAPSPQWFQSYLDGGVSARIDGDAVREQAVDKVKTEEQAAFLANVRKTLVALAEHEESRSKVIKVCHQANLIETFNQRVLKFTDPAHSSHASQVEKWVHQNLVQKVDTLYRA